MSQEDVLARAWRGVAATPEDPGAWGALARHLARRQADPWTAFRRGLRELSGAGRPPLGAVHHLTRAAGLGFGDPRLRWPARVRTLAARPSGTGALAEDADGRALWVDTATLLVRELPLEPLVGERPQARGLRADGRPWVARRGLPDEGSLEGVFRVTWWDPAHEAAEEEAAEHLDLAIGDVVGDPLFLWGLPEGPHVLARVATGEVHLLGRACDHPLPGLSRGFGPGLVALPDGHLLGPVRDDSDALRLARIDAADGSIVDPGPPLAAEDRMLASWDGAWVAVYRRQTRGASVQVLALPSWRSAMHAPLVQGFLGWSAAGHLILGPSATGHLGRWIPGEANASRLSSPPPEAAARYALLREEPAELLMLDGGRLLLHDLETATRVGAAGGKGVAVTGEGMWARVAAERLETWSATSGARTRDTALPPGTPWDLGSGRFGHEVRGRGAATPRVVVRDLAGAVLHEEDLAGARLVAARGTAPMVMLLRRGEEGGELREVDLETGETRRARLLLDPTRLQGGGLWVAGELAWVLLEDEDSSEPGGYLALEARRLRDGAEPRPGAGAGEGPGEGAGTGADAAPADLRFSARRRDAAHPALRNAPRRDPREPWVWLPDEEETRAISPELVVTRRLAHPPADHGPMALSPSGARLARGLADGVRVWDTATGEVLAERRPGVPVDDLAFLGETELVILRGDGAARLVLDEA